MPAVDDYIQTVPDSTGKMLRCFKVSVPGIGDTEQEVIVIADSLGNIISPIQIGDLSVDGSKYLAVNVKSQPNTIFASDSAGNVGIDNMHDRFENKRWLLEEQSFSEGWDWGFQKYLYHGRRGGYFESENSTDYASWTLPSIIADDNVLEPAPYDDALSIKNSKDGVTVDPLYFGIHKAFHEFLLVFEAKLPNPAGLTGLHIGAEVTRGGSFAGLVDLNCESGAWRLEAINHMHAYAAALTDAVTINNTGVYARYALRYKPPTLKFYQPAGADPTGQMSCTNTLDLQDICGKFIPFFANEMPATVSEYRLGNFWIYELPKEPRYQSARVDTSTDGATVVAAVAGQAIYVTGYQLQGQGTVQATLGDDTPADLSMHWKLQDREGAIGQPVDWPKYYFKTGIGKKLIINLGAIVTVTGNVQYVQE